MSKESAGVVWAKKMSDVLGKHNQPTKAGDEEAPGAETANGAPSGGAAPTGGGGPSGGGSGGGGGPSGGGPESGGGGKSGGGAPTGGAATGAGSPPAGPAGKGDGGGSQVPTIGDAPAGTPTGAGAKGFAEAAQKALADINALVSQAKTVESEGAKFTSDAQAGKKQADDAKRQAETEANGLPAVPQVPTPQGNDAKAQYESAITITGDIRKVQQDADAKAAAVREQEGVAQEGAAKVKVAHESAKASAEKVSRLAESGVGLIKAAGDAASSASSAAAESKQKADQAAKDKAADKDTLAKAAQEDAQHASAANTASNSVQTAAQQLAASSESAVKQSEGIDKIGQEAKSAVDAIGQTISGLDAKLQPFQEAVDKAEVQEEQYKAAAGADAEAILQKKYEELGGDPELTKALADQDKEFELHVEKFRAEIKRWQNNETRKLDEHKTQLDSWLKQGEALVPPWKEYYEREEPLAKQISADANSLGEKLQTEPGKELMHEINQRTAKIASAKRSVAFNEKVIERTKAARESLEKRYKDLDTQYEAAEKYTQDLRTELDNTLQANSMSLDQKVNFLQTKPKPVRDRIQKQLDSERKRILALSVLDSQAEMPKFEPPPEKEQPGVIDWVPIKDMIVKLQAATLEELQQDDPALADIQKEYDHAGGDPALLEKRVNEWKNKVEQAAQEEDKFADEYKERSEKLHNQLQAAEERVKNVEDGCHYLESEIGQATTRYLALFERIDPSTGASDLTTHEQAELKLLGQTLKRLEKTLANNQAVLPPAISERDNAKKQIELERQRHEQVMDDERKVLPKPTSEDIHMMPLRAKYTELTGKTAPPPLQPRGRYSR